ncbi:DUF7684 family protein [Chitinilyticum piscinae]|uniref:DUF7684 domain-containing protein n=1 Tax=Chitinilyticum piscinae TaxID=2866724 RepID=A0A8J7KAD0_9NEIS|nr:hypothetical protein [Chitinilyticum piscinae]MBE9609004.1 hypothetical protein [Chitinilyticum piscinae]
MNQAYKYIALCPEAVLPEPGSSMPYKAIIWIESPSTAQWREAVCYWLVKSGCLYALCVGTDCEIWHDLIDETLLEEFGWQGIPDDRSIMTTWHTEETLGQVYEFAQLHARHPAVALDGLSILHITEKVMPPELLAAALANCA